jgi:hypothetical protein
MLRGSDEPQGLTKTVPFWYPLVVERRTDLAYSRAAGAGASYRLQATPSSSHFGGRLGSGFAGSAAASGPMRSYPSYSGARPYFGSGIPARDAERVARGPAVLLADGREVCAPCQRVPAIHSHGRVPVVGSSRGRVPIFSWCLQFS